MLCWSFSVNYYTEFEYFGAQLDAKRNVGNKVVVMRVFFWSLNQYEKIPKKKRRQKIALSSQNFQRVIVVGYRIFICSSTSPCCPCSCWRARDLWNGTQSSWSGRDRRPGLGTGPRSSGSAVPGSDAGSADGEQPCPPKRYMKKLSVWWLSSKLKQDGL